MSVLSSLFVGIDVSKNSNQVYAMNFDQEKLLSFSGMLYLLVFYHIKPSNTTLKTFFIFSYYLTNNHNQAN